MSDVIASPSVRALAARKGIALEKLAQELGRGTILREDIESVHQSSKGSAWDVDHSAFGPVVEEPLSRFARLAGENLTSSTQFIPSVTHHDSAEVSILETFRRSIEPEAEAKGIRITALAFQIKVLARALREFPKFNASLNRQGTILIKKGYVNIGVAVDTPHGLVVPVMRDADQKGVFALAAELSDVAGRARDRKTRPEDLGGCSMTVSSLGGIGGESFTPIINPPELAILGISKVVTRPVWNGHAFEPASVLPLDLTYDHRVINGAEAARFLCYLCALLEEPARIMV